MTERAFVDTNVWVYAVDDADPAKQARARAILAPTSGTELVLSAQVLGEFYVTVTRKLHRVVPEIQAQAMVEQMARLRVAPIDADLVATAVARSRAWRISYWDALVIATAASAGCSVVLSEDLGDGIRYDSVRLDNPFRGGHRVSETAGAREESPIDREAGLRARWDDASLADELTRYEQACRDAGMKPNAIHSYWDYAHRFLDWRVGTYRPRGTPERGRPVPTSAVNTDELGRQADEYAQAIAAAGRARDTTETYHRHAMFFVRWLQGEFRPGGRLR